MSNELGFFQKMGQGIKNNFAGGIFSEGFGQEAGNQAVDNFTSNNPFGKTVTLDDGTMQYVDKEGNIMDPNEIELKKKEGWEVDAEGNWGVSDKKREELFGAGVKKEKTKSFFGNIGESLLAAASSNSNYAQPHQKQMMGGIDYRT